MSGIQQLLLGGPFGAGAQGDPNWQNVTLLSGTTTTNTGQNNTFLDSSGNGLNPTRNGNTTQGTFSPFSQANGYWGAYFDGSSTGYIETAATSVCDQNQTFTFQCWIYPTKFVTSTSAVRRMYIFVKGIIYAGLSIHSDGTLGWYGYPSGSIVTSSPAGTIVTNAWQHIAIIVNPSSNYIKLYRNGLEVGTSAYAGYGTNGAAIRIGNGDTSQSTDAFNGYITNVKISQSVATLDYSTTPIPSTTSGASILTLQSNRFVDSTANTTITPYSGASIQLFTPFGAPTSPYSTTNIGGSGYFDGTGDSLTRATSAPLQFGTGDLTVEFWVYGLASGRQDWFEMPGTNRIQFLFEGTNVGVYINNGFVVGAATTPVLNQWNHLAWTRSSGTNRVFLNGVQLGSNVSNSTNFSDNSVTVGTSVGGQDVRGYFSGVRLLKGTAQYTANFTPPTAPPTAITNTSLLLNFTNANIYDQAAKNDLETVGNAQVSTSVKKFGDSSFYFDGAGDYLKFPTSNLFNPYQGQYTVEMWIYPTSLSSGGTASSRYGTLLNQETPGSSIQWGLGFNSSGQLIYTYWNGSATVQITGSGGIAVNAWSYVGFIYINNSLALFVNGNLSALTAITTPSSSTTEPMFIGLEGRTNGSELYYQGYISDLRITKGLARYPYNFTPPTTSLPNFYQAQTLTADPYFEYTTLLLPGSGTNLSNNNAFLDSSGNGFNPTRNGNTTQGTFSPFSQTGWSNYFDGNDYLSGIGTTSSFNFMHNTTALFTFECWVYVSSTAATQTLIDNTSGTSSQIGCAIYVDAGGTVSVFITRGVTGVPNVTAYVTSSGTVAVNQWNHIAVTYDQSLGSNNAKFYINGASAGQGSKTGNTPSSSNASNAMRIGTYGAGAGDFVTGYISNLRISNSIVYSAAFTPSTSPLTTSSQGATSVALLTCQSNRFVDNSSNAFAITVNGNPSVQAFSPFNPTAAYSAATNGGSGYFDGTGDYLSVAGASQLRPGTGDFTLEGWFYLNNFTGDKYLINQNFNNADGSFGNFLIYVTGTTGVMKYWSSTNGSSWNNVAGIALGTAKLNEWFHVAVSRLSGTTKTFLNGVEQASQADSGNLNNTGGIYVGTYAPGQANVNGYASGVRLLVGTGYSSISIPTAPPTAITNTALLLNFTNAGITDATAKNDLETVGNAQISNGAAKFGSTSMKFDGNGDFLFLPPNNQNLIFGSGDWTIEFWMYTSDVTTYQDLIGLNYNSNASSYGSARLVLTSGQIQVLASTSGSNWEVATTIGSVSANTWTHIAYTRYGGSLQLFINGNLAGSASISGSLYAGTYGSLIANLYWSGGNFYYNGYMQDVRITKGIARYTQNFTPPTAAFQLL